jgi:hypothetical protein
MRGWESIRTRERGRKRMSRRRRREEEEEAVRQ